MKKWFLIAWLAVLFSGIGFLFWHNELVYSLPTPIPAKYRPVNTGDKIDLGNKIAVNGKPLFIHFFNPACPCSRFNIPHFKSLVKNNKDEISFAIVVLSKDKKYSEKEIQEKFDLDVPVYFDKSIADACGVYSTPQAVIIEPGNKLYYRGNYNKSRYCTDKNSNYAAMAIDSLVHKTSHPHFSQYALVSYGCTLPTCTK